MNSLDQILTVLVLHNMDLQDSVAYQSLTRSLRFHNIKAYLFIYDNSPIRQTIPESDCWEISYFQDAANPGVSRAYNLGSVFANRLQKKWLLLADQDTTFPDDIFEKYLHSMNLHPDCAVFAPILNDTKGVVSPFKPGLTSGVRLKKSVAGRQSLSQIHAINSGLMVGLQMFESAGGYDERFKLDFSDIVFFSRLKHQTQYLVIVDAPCQHGHSSQQKGNTEFVLNRFNGYLHAVSILDNGRKTRMAFFIRACMRAVKLSLQHKSTRFVGSLFGAT